MSFQAFQSFQILGVEFESISNSTWKCLTRGASKCVVELQVFIVVKWRSFARKYFSGGIKLPAKIPKKQEEGGGKFHTQFIH